MKTFKLKEIKKVEKVYSKNTIVCDINVENDNSFTITNDLNKNLIVHNSGCTTRVQTGVGVPQISMIQEIVKYKQDTGSNILLCTDGGCTVPGDISKAFVAGTDFVMLGGMLAGHKENPGTIEEIDGRKVKRFSGMAANESQHEGVPEYGVAEGRTVMIPYRGEIIETLKDIEGGIRSCCTYINAQNINEMKNAELIYTNNTQENKIFTEL